MRDHPHMPLSERIVLPMSGLAQRLAPPTCLRSVSARVAGRGAAGFLVMSAVLLTVTACTGPTSRQPTSRSTKPAAGGSVRSPTTLPTESVAPPRADKTGAKQGKTQPLTRFQHGDGLTSKGRNKCSNMPFPGSILSVYQAHECWIGSSNHHYVMYMLGYKPGPMLGYKPGTHRRQPQMIVVWPQGERVVNLRSGDGLATLAHFGRTCGVVTYARSPRKTYYVPFRRKIVRHCRWRH